VDRLREGEPHGARFEELLTRFTDREADAVHHVQSALVRLSARSALANAIGADESRLEIVCEPGPTGRRPPRVYLDGAAAADLDVSLSHDGDWIAWAYSAASGDSGAS
jgi:hypothetical protein